MMRESAQGTSLFYFNKNNLHILYNLGIKENSLKVKLSSSTLAQPRNLKTS